MESRSVKKSKLLTESCKLCIFKPEAKTFKNKSDLDDVNKIKKSLKSKRALHNLNNNNHYFNPPLSFVSSHSNIIRYTKISDDNAGKKNQKCSNKVYSSCQEYPINMKPYKKMRRKSSSLKPADTDYKCFKKQCNLFSLNILKHIFIHYLLIFFILVLFKFLKVNKSNYSMQVFLAKIFNNSIVSSTSIIWCSSGLSLTFFILLILCPKLRSCKPVNFIVFFFYTASIGLFYSYLMETYSTDFFLEFNTIVLISLVLLVIFCLQNKFTLFNVPSLPYVFVYTVLVVFLVIYSVTKIYSAQIKIPNIGNQIMHARGKTSLTTTGLPVQDSIDLKKMFETFNLIEYFVSVLISFIFVFYVIFDLQFILVRYDYADESNNSAFLSAFNLLTKDMLEMFLLLNTFLLNLIK